LQFAADWDGLRNRLYAVGRSLKAAGADGIVLCTNTMHKVMDSFEADMGIPFLHIVDVLGAALVRDGRTKVGLLGTRFTMEDGFYSRRLEERHGLEVITPGLQARYEVHRIIYEELVRGCGVGRIPKNLPPGYRRLGARRRRGGDFGLHRDRSSGPIGVVSPLRYDNSPFTGGGPLGGG
jgi:aspartate racemase